MSTFPPIDVHSKIYAPVGRCIYCGSDGGDDGLRDEHIIPFSLGGNAVLPKASCKSCEAVTSYLDGYLARHTFYDLRLHSGVQSRRKEKPNARPAIISDGKKDTVINFDLVDHPHFLNLPVWGRPGIMVGDHPSEEFSEQRSCTFYHVPPHFFEKYKLPKEGSIKSEIRINFGTFARAITKIAFAQTVAHLGGLVFRPLYTPAIVLGTYRYIPHFVGTDFSEPVPPPDRAHLRHKIEYGMYELDRLALIYIRVRLFADCGTPEAGMPTYEVLVGALKGPDARKKLIP